MDDHQEVSKVKLGGDRKINGNGVKGKDAEPSRRMMRRNIVVEDVNEMADDFINNFRKQLKFEREESIKRFHEMIDRGA